MLDKFEEIEEGFANYFESIDREQVKRTKLEEEYCRKSFGYKTMPDETYKSYKKVSEGKGESNVKEFIKDNYSYNILKNRFYFDMFQYGYTCEEDDHQSYLWHSLKP